MQKSLLEKLVFVSIKSNKNCLVLCLTFLAVVLFFSLKKFSYFRPSAVAETTEQ